MNKKTDSKTPKSEVTAFISPQILAEFIKKLYKGILNYKVF